MHVLKCELNKIRDNYERFGTVITFLRTTKLKAPVTRLRPTQKQIRMSVFEKKSNYTVTEHIFSIHIQVHFFLQHNK